MPPLAPDYTVFVRGFHNSALVRLETVFQTSDAWWDVDNAEDLSERCGLTHR
jgi:hypothetical protein